MTTTVVTDRTGPLTAVGDSAPLPFTFQAIPGSGQTVAELEVYLDDVLVDPNDYAIVLNGDGTGSVIPDTPWAGEVYILSAPTFEQPFSFNRFSPLYPDQIVPPLDHMARGIIALKNRLLRGLPLIGSVGTGDAGDPASVTQRVADGGQTYWDFSLPRGDQGPAGDVAKAADRTELSETVAISDMVRYLAEGERSGSFVYDGSDLSAQVAEDTEQALYVAPASDPTGASGAWVRRYVGPKDARWFGAVGDGVTDDGAALQAWLDSGGDLVLPPKPFVSNQALKLRRNATVKGVSYGFDSRIAMGPARNHPGSRIIFGEGAGFTIEGSTTLLSKSAVDAAGAGAWTQEGAFQSSVSEIALIGAGTGAVVAGLYARTLIYLDRIYVAGFTGKGFDVSASADMDDALAEYGNASLSRLQTCSAIGNGGHGFHIRGRDANVIKLDTCNARSNGGWGYYDDGLLGNTYINCHAAGNTGGAFKATGLVANHTYSGCYVEGDGGATNSLPDICTINGGLGMGGDGPNHVGFRITGKVGPTWMGDGSGYVASTIPALATGLGATRADPNLLMGYSIGQFYFDSRDGSKDVNFSRDYYHHFDTSSGDFLWTGPDGQSFWKDPGRWSSAARAYGRSYTNGIFLGPSFNVRLGSYDPFSAMPTGAYRIGDTFLTRDSSVSSLFRVTQATGIVCNDAWTAGEQLFSTTTSQHSTYYRKNAGNVYRLVSIATPNAPMANAPTHGAGTVVGADGYGWLYMNADGAVTFVDVVPPDGTIKLANDILRRSNDAAVLNARGFDILFYSGSFKFVSSDNLGIWEVAITSAGDADITGSINLSAGKVLKIGGTQVVGARGAAVADAAVAAAAPTKAEFDALVGTVNTLLARLRAATGHGLIA